jgi:uncharacterized protein
MSGETNIALLLKNMTPKLNEGEYVFCTLLSIGSLNTEDIIGTFKEEEGWTVILTKLLADKLNYKYSYIVSWITLTVHSSLEAVGLTAAFSQALADASISCNIVAAYYHDHIFVPQQDADKAMKALMQLSKDNY